MAENGKRATRTFGSFGEAFAMREKLLGEICGRAEATVAAALDAYAEHMRAGERKPSSIEVTRSRLGGFFAGTLDWPLAKLDGTTCARLYETLRTTPSGRTKRTLAADTQLNVLAQARTFLDWAVHKQRWLAANPLAGVEGEGKRRKGKPQLRVSEARRWQQAAMELAAKGGEDFERGVAAMLTLALGVRECEVLSRQARDIDDDGRLFWIPSTKTDNGRRYLEVPDFLVPYLCRLVEGKPPEARVFEHRRGWVSDQVAHICKLAGLPVVKAQSMRGLHGTLSREAGVTSHVIAAALGHGSPRVTEASYIAPGTCERANLQRVMQVLQGGLR